MEAKLIAIFTLTVLNVLSASGTEEKADTCDVSKEEQLLEKMIMTEVNVDAMLDEMKKTEKQVLSVLENRKQEVQRTQTQDTNYVGCFEDDSTRVLEKRITYGDITVENCIHNCSHAGYDLAGVENGYECYCGNNLRRIQKLSESSCSTECYGNHSQICGGHWTISVYKTNGTDEKADTCYLSQEEQLFTKMIKTEVKVKAMFRKMKKTEKLVSSVLENRKQAVETNKTQGSDEKADTCDLSQEEQLLKKMIKTEIKVKAMFKKMKKTEKMVSSVLENHKQEVHKPQLQGTDEKADTCDVSKEEELLEKMIKTEVEVEAMLDEMKETKKQVLSALESRRLEVQTQDDNYVGCFKDDSSRVLGDMITYEDMTVEKCIQNCSYAGYDLAGVEAASQCFCGNNLRRIQKLSESSCSAECSGNSSQICGGTWTISVYKTNEYLGCYVDKVIRLLEGPQISNVKMTTEFCINLCRNNGTRYALTENSDQCFCGNNLLTYEKRNNDECYQKCAGAKSESCGGPWRASLYLVQ